MSATAYMVTPRIVGLRFETGAVVEPGRTEPYRAAPGDRLSGDGLISRGGEVLGLATATPSGQRMVQGFDRFAADPAEAFFQGATPQVWGLPLRFLAEPPRAHEPGRYSLQMAGEAAGDAGGFAPKAVWRKSKIVDTARIGPKETAPVVQHDVLLELAAPLEPGEAYTVAIDHPALAPVTFTYDTAALRSEAVHVSQVGFRPDDPLKAAWLSFWRGGNAIDPTADPAVDYAEGTAFRLLDTVTGEAVYAGLSRLDAPAEAPRNLRQNYNLTDVHILDFSDFAQPGQYVVEVEGVGTSYPFTIAEGVWTEAFRTAMQGFYHQRSGITLEPEFTDWARPRSLHPADGITVRQSTATLMDTDQGLNLLGQKSFDALVAGATPEVVAAAWGGWHDAGDWDRRAQHLQAAHELLDLAELRPAFAAATRLGVPEAGDAVPDLVDEALWAIDFWARLQKPDGGVPGGIEAGAYPPLGETSWTSSQDFYVYAPDAWSSYLFAGTAARAAFVVAPDDPARAADYEASALAAMRWAEANLPDHAEGHVAVVNARNLAAAELFRLTGDEAWHAVFKASSAYAEARELTPETHQFAATMVYAAAGGPIDAAILARGMDAITGYADFLLATGDRGGFGQLMNPWTPYGWSYTSAIPVEADVMIKAHVLTGDERYFKALIGETQFGLGANPDNMTFTTGLGHASPREVLLVDKYGMGGVPDGLTLFGGWNVGDRGQHWSFEQAAQHMTPRFPDAWPVHETFIGHFWAVPITEYTIHGTLARVAKAWGYIAASDAAGERPLARDTSEAAAAPPARPEAAADGAAPPGDGAAVLILPDLPDRGVVLVSAAPGAQAPGAAGLATGLPGPSGGLAPAAASYGGGAPLEPDQLLDRGGLPDPAETASWAARPSLADIIAASAAPPAPAALLDDLLGRAGLEAMGPLG